MDAALKHFLECCRTRASPITDWEEGEQVLNGLAAAEESLREKCPIVMAASDTENGNHNNVVKMEDDAVPV